MNRLWFSKKRNIFIALISMLTIVGVIATLTINTHIKDTLSNRVTILDTFEITKLWVIEDVRDYLSTTDSTWESNKRNSHFSNELKARLYGANYSKDSFIQATNVSIVDCQYTLDTETYMFFVSANVTIDNQTKELRFIVYVDNNMIYDIMSI